MKVGDKVRIQTLVGPRFEPHWSETGRIARNHPSWKGREVPKGYHTVRYDSDGGRLMIHESQLMLSNDQRGA
jgi:hypothetical protein